MSQSDGKATEGKPSGARRAVALQYAMGEGAPVVVASGMGYLAEKIVEVAAEGGVPIYEDNSLVTMLAQLQLGQEVPEALYQAIVDIYLYFLEFDPSSPEKPQIEFGKAAAEEEEKKAKEGV